MVCGHCQLCWYMTCWTYNNDWEKYWINEINGWMVFW